RAHRRGDHAARRAKRGRAARPPTHQVPRAARPPAHGREYTRTVAWRPRHADWLTAANTAALLRVADASTTADVLIGTLESRHIHAYMQQVEFSSKQHRDYIRAMLDVVFPERG